MPEFVAQSHKLPPAAQVAYGDHPDQVGNLHLPAGDESRLAGGAAGTWPAVVLIHGGFWRWGWDRTLTTRLAHDLAGRGFAAWNIEYRRVGQEGGGQADDRHKEEGAHGGCESGPIIPVPPEA